MKAVSERYEVISNSQPGDYINGIPYDFAGNIKEQNTYKKLEFTISKATFEGARRISNDKTKGIYAFLITGVYYMIYRYSQNDDIVIAMPDFRHQTVDGRKKTILAVRQKVDSHVLYSEFLEQVSRSIYDNGYTEDLPSNIKEGPLNSGELIQAGTLVLFDKAYNIDLLDEIESDIAYYFKIKEDTADIEISYNTQLYNESTIQKLGELLLKFYDTVSGNLAIKLSCIDILSAEERKAVLEEFNSNCSEYDKNTTIQAMFREQVKRTPEKTAAVCADACLTYYELDLRSDQFAAMLIEEGVKTGDVIAVMMERSINMLVVFLGILKTGAVCLPIDIQYPENRVKFMLKDSITQFLVVDSNLSKHGVNCRIINYSDVDFGSYSLEGKKPGCDSDTPAYIIYTSGSEGRPKGITLNHRGIINHIITKADLLDINESVLISHNINLSFVASIWIIYTPLVTGAKLIIYNNSILMDSVTLFEQVDTDGISIMEVVPSVLNSYLELIKLTNKKAGLSKLKHLVVTGERVSPELVNKFYREYPYISLINAYGQTECSDDTLHYRIPFDIKTTSVPIGKPAKNTSVYILSNDLQPQPVGVGGELYISGDGVCKGYINNPELTSLKFLPNPFIHGKIMYRTGDFARWRQDGNVEYLGRRDQQVKIHGYRIETDEIEGCLMQHHLVIQAVVCVREDHLKGKHLCAYVTLKENIETDILKEYLKLYLPQYMIPGYIVKMDTFPVSPNGKISRNDFPIPREIASESSMESENMSNTEKKIAEIWGKLLNAGNLKADDNFFKCGGNSFLATKLIMLLYKEFNKDISLKDIFRMATIREMGRLIEYGDNDCCRPIENIAKQRYYQLSSAQKRLFMVDQIEGPNIKYNIPNVVVLEGRLNRKRFRKAYEDLFQRHEILRTSFDFIDGEPVQKVWQDIECDIQYIEAGEELVEKMVRNFIKPFNLNEAPLVRMVLVKVSDTRHYMFIDIHHIIFDGASMGIILKDLMSLYDGVSLPALKIQYKDFS
ncbi:MAG TPA: amino acid adenylation domain-containing protein, partial [Ruminiclostridium sp.]|nr:amino acid adenylation domain-containing protein [Ruminiclostridium sp.]